MTSVTIQVTRTGAIFLRLFLCWGWLLSRYDLRPIEVLFLFVFIIPLVVWLVWRAMVSTWHLVTRKVRDTFL
jgi:hypothetical protein